MNPWWALVPAAAVLFLGSWTSYKPEIKASPLFPWLMVGFCVGNGLAWAWAVQRTADRREIYSLSIAWDVLTILMYNLMPLALCGVQLSWKAWTGLAMVVCGACLIKWS